MNKPLIFVTTGTQLPFERLISQVDRWAGVNNNVNVVAQTANSKAKYYHLKSVDFLTPQEYDEYTSLADVIVGHAGMGTIITGIEKNKPTILMARKFEYGEHRNDHQNATVEKFKRTKGIYIAKNDTELNFFLDIHDKLQSAESVDIDNRTMLIEYLSSEIKGG
ncbi:glycosyltransferase [Shewanella frigidimarina]|uniref:glycosyltransferase n=1 Tax=Shewanella frigidimarina TaxID=56812 RepID=UPI003FA1035A